MLGIAAIFLLIHSMSEGRPDMVVLSFIVLWHFWMKD